MSLDAEGRLVISGSFTNVSGQARRSLARILPSGQVDATFAPVVDGTVKTIGVQADQRILIGGEIYSVNGIMRTNLVRLMSSGVLDWSFSSMVAGDYLWGSVNSVICQPDSRIVVGGQFSRVNAQSRYSLARLTAGGAADPGFLAEFCYEVRSLGLQADGRIWVAEAPNKGVFRLMADGQSDPSVSPAWGEGHAVLPLPEGRYVVSVSYSQGGATYLRRVTLAEPPGSLL